MHNKDTREQDRTMSLLENKIALPAIVLAVAVGVGAYLFVNEGTAPEEEMTQGSTATEEQSAAATESANASIVPEAAAQSTDDAPEGSPLITPRVLGDPNAPVHMIEYSSLTCPHCASFHRETLPLIKERYIDTGQLRLEIRDFPLNEQAAVGALVARCATEERYFPLVELLFAQQQRWANSQNIVGELAQLASFAGMSQETLEACFENQELFAAIVEQRGVWANTHEVSSTPTFYINGTPVIGSQPFEDFEAVIEAELN